MEEGTRNIKIVLVGDSGVGKKTFVLCYGIKRFEVNYFPGVIYPYVEELTIDRTRVKLELIMSAGQEDTLETKLLILPKADVVVMCYSCVNKVSFDNLESFWYPLVEEAVPEAAVTIVGMKEDLKETHPDDAVSTGALTMLGQALNVNHSMECSCLWLDSDRNKSKVDEVIANAVRSALEGKGRISTKCFACIIL